MIPKSPLIKETSSEALSLFKKAIDATGEYKEQISRGYLSVLLGILFEKAELTLSVKTEKSTVQRIIDYCSINYKKIFRIML